MRQKRIALCWLDEDNLGDVVIRDCVVWLMDRCASESRCPVDIVPVDIGGRAGRSGCGGSRGRRRRLGIRKRLARVARALSALPFLRRPVCAIADATLMAIWRRSARYRAFAAAERERLLGADAILFAGGGLVKFRRQDFNYMLFDITELADSKGIPVFINATGVEGFDPRDPECHLLCVALNRRCVKSITTRDDLELLSRAYVWRDGIEISRVCDPALWVREAYGIGRCDSAAGAIGVNVVRLDLFTAYGVTFGAKELLRLYVELVKGLAGRGCRVVLFTNGSGRDAQALEEVAASCRACSPDGTVRTARPGSPQELVALIAGFSRFLAVRLHASIIGVSLGVPNASLVWNRKQSLFGRQIGMEENFLSVGKFDAMTVLSALDSAKPCAIDAGYKDSVCRSLERTVRTLSMSREGIYETGSVQ